MELTILSPEQKRTLSIDWIELNTPSGSFVILQGHAPMVLTLKANSSITFCFEGNKQETMAVPGGFAHITRNAVMLLLKQ